MRVLFVGMQWDYGFPERGLSHEYTNLYDALRHMDGVEARLYDFMAAFKEGGHDEVSRGLRAAVDEWRPRLAFFVLFTDEIPPEALLELRDRDDVTTFNWFCDDHWRFDDFTRHWAPRFDACSTTARSALPKYAAIGYDQVIKTQWACNQHLYRPTGRPPRHDITFVGQPHGDRRHVVEDLRRHGLPVQVWGTGWDTGRLSQEEMIAVFAESRVNLNLSNASVPLSLWRRLRARRGYSDQIKGRNFEIPGCGGFQLSGASEDLESYFEPDREIVIAHSTAELAEQASRYLTDEPARAAIAGAGYRRTLAEHTYERRFRAIFDELGLA